MLSPLSYAQLDVPSPTVAEGIRQLRVLTTSAPATPLLPHQLVVTIHSTCINYPDLLMLSNDYQHTPSFPFTPGLEWAGEITQVGSSISQYKPGDRVTGTGLGLSTHRILDPTSTPLTPIPSNLTYPQAAAFWVGFSTAYHCLVERAQLQKGQWILINGGTGGMGMAAVLLAKHLGAHVICTGGTDVKLQQVATFAGLPLHQCINYTTHPKFAALVKGCTPNSRGVDVVFDPVGGPVGMESVRATTWGATVLVVGFTGASDAAQKQQYAANYILIKGLTVMGCRAGEYIRRTENGATAVGQPRRARLMAMAEEGLVPLVCREYSLTTKGVRDCFGDLYERRITGRACVVMHVAKL